MIKGVFVDTITRKIYLKVINMEGYSVNDLYRIYSIPRTKYEFISEGKLGKNIKDINSQSRIFMDNSVEDISKQLYIYTFNKKMKTSVGDVIIDKKKINTKSELTQKDIDEIENDIGMKFVKVKCIVK